MTKEEILKAKGITESTKHHSYEYLYKSMIVAMDEYTSALRSENERLKSELSGNPEQLGWISVKDDMPEELETVWISNGKGWTALGCTVGTTDGYYWAESNGVIYEENGKIVSECDADDLDVVFWHRLPSPPKQ